MSTTKKIAQNTAIQIVGKAVSTLFGLVALGMLTRYLGNEQFGWYITALTFLQFVGILIDFGLIPVTAQMVSEATENKETLLQNLLGFRFVTAVIFLGIAPLIAIFFPYPSEVKIAIGFMTISFLAISMNQIFTGLYQEKLAMHIPVLGEIAGRIALVVSVWLLITMKQGFLPLMGAVTGASLIFTAVLWGSAGTYIKPTFRFDWPVWKKIMTKMWPITLAIVFNVIYLRGDTLLLSLYRSQGEVGLYGAAYRVIDILTQIAMMLIGVLLPLLAYSWSRGLKNEFRQRLQQSFDVMIFIGAPMMIGVAALSEKIMVLVAGNNFAAAGAPLRVLALAVLGLYLWAIFGHTAVAINKQKQTLWIYISSAGLTLLGYLIFIPKFGMSGAAWMTVFSEMFTGTLLFLVVRHYAKESLQFAAAGKIIFSALVMGGIIWLLREQSLFLLIPIGIAAYGSFVFGLGAISKQTMQEILSFRKPPI